MDLGNDRRFVLDLWDTGEHRQAGLPRSGSPCSIW